MGFRGHFFFIAFTFSYKTGLGFSFRVGRTGSQLARYGAALILVYSPIWREMSHVNKMQSFYSQKNIRIN